MSRKQQFYILYHEKKGNSEKRSPPMVSMKYRSKYDIAFGKNYKKNCKVKTEKSFNKYTQVTILTLVRTCNNKFKIHPSLLCS